MYFPTCPKCNSSCVVDSEYFWKCCACHHYWDHTYGPWNKICPWCGAYAKRKPNDYLYICSCGYTGYGY